MQCMHSRPCTKTQSRSSVKRQRRRVDILANRANSLPHSFSEKTHRLSGSVTTSAAPARPSAPRPTTAELMPPEATAASPRSPNTPRGGDGPRRVIEEGAAIARRGAAAAREETGRATPAVVDDVRLPLIVRDFDKKAREGGEGEERKKHAFSRREKKTGM